MDDHFNLPKPVLRGTNLTDEQITNKIKKLGSYNFNSQLILVSSPAFFLIIPPLTVNPKVVEVAPYAPYIGTMVFIGAPVAFLAALCVLTTSTVKLKKYKALQSSLNNYSP